MSEPTGVPEPVAGPTSPAVPGSVGAPESIDPPAAQDPDATVPDLEADLSATRDRLAASVEALAAKADVKAQTQAKVDETTQQLKSFADQGLRRVQQLSPGQLAAGAAAVVGATVLTVLTVRSIRR